MRSQQETRQVRRHNPEGPPRDSEPIGAAAMRDRPTSRRSRPRRRGRALAAFAATAVTVAATGALGGAPALAASRPTVNTGSAAQVGYASAVLHGTLDPRGGDTSYYFQYGLTGAFGQQTGVLDAGSGSANVAVSVPITGLAPLTLYHYRLVAVNGAGISIGGDRTLVTTKIPLSLAIIVAPGPISFGGTTEVQGTLSGTGNGQREVMLEANPFPYTAGFQPLGNPELTNADGSFSFPVLGLEQVTQFRVVTTTSPQVASPTTVEQVAVIVHSHVGRARQGHVRIFGTVTPAANGMHVGVVRVEHGRYVLVGGTITRPAGTGGSSFSRVIPAQRGIYRVVVHVTTGAQISSFGPPMAIG
jgi:hypothetical protein